MRPLPSVALRLDGKILGRCDRSEAPRIGEIANLEDPSFSGAGRTRYRCVGIERFYEGTRLSRSAPPGFTAGDVLCDLKWLDDTPTQGPEYRRVELVSNGRILGYTARGVEARLGEVCSLEFDESRRRYRVQEVENWYGDVAPAGDGLTVVYQHIGMICQVIQIGV